MSWLQENGLFYLLLLAALLFVFRGPILARLFRVERLSVHELSKQMASPSPPLLLDVRSQSEFQSGHIRNAVLMPVAELHQRMESLRKSGLSRPVAVICLSGSRSVLGAVMLKRAGFERVYNVVGGMAHWKAQGYPVC